MSFTAVGRDTQRLLPTRCRDPTDIHHQGPVGVKGSADRQGVHVLREKGLVGKGVADTPIIQDLKGRDGAERLQQRRQEEEASKKGLKGGR